MDGKQGGREEGQEGGEGERERKEKREEVKELEKGGGVKGRTLCLAATSVTLTHEGGGAKDSQVQG